MERLDEVEARAEAIPHRRKYLLFVTGFLRDYLELHSELVDTVERQFEAASEGVVSIPPAEAAGTQ